MNTIALDNKGHIQSERKQLLVRYQEKILHCEVSEALEQVAQGNSGCLMPRSAQGQAEQRSEQRDLVKDVPIHGRGVGTG